MKVRKWLRNVFLFPFTLLMGVPGEVGDGQDGSDDTSDQDDQGADDNSTDDGQDDDSGEGDDQGADDQGAGDGQDEGKDYTAPVIPRKAYQAEKEKRQGLEKRVQEMEQQLAAAKTAAATPKQPQTIEEAFDQNPEGVLTYVDQQIAAANAAYDPDEAQKWKDAKVDLVARGLKSQHQRQTKESHVAKINTEIYKAIPDFDTKRPELVALATEYGLTEQEAVDIFNPEVVGDSAARMAKVFNKVHTIVNAGKTAKAKEVKTPPRTEGAGTGGFSNSNPTNKQLNRAKETGNLDDWAALLG